MPKGYWIGRVTVSDPANYPKYIEANRAPFEKYGARFLVRGGRYEAVEGKARERNVVIEFESYEKALACYRSPEYQAAVNLRQDCSEAEILVIEGVE